MSVCIVCPGLTLSKISFAKIPTSEVASVVAALAQVLKLPKIKSYKPNTHVIEGIDMNNLCELLNKHGSKTLKDALNEAMRDWVTNVSDTFYIIGTVAGPHPYPMMVRDFQAVIGQECIRQMPKRAGGQPDYVLACVGGGSNAIGIFHPYIEHEDVKLIGVEAGGEGLSSGKHSASLSAGVPGVLHGNRTYLLQDKDGQIIETHSVSAGLDYPGVGPEHAWLKDSGRASYVAVDDKQALKAFHDCCRIEGIIPALESSHAIAHAVQLAPTLDKDKRILVNLSGRGDKDMHTVYQQDQSGNS